jgi:hypothetical protein
MSSNTQKRVGFQTDYNIPRFGFKSALILILAGILSTFFLPYVLGYMHVPNKIAIVFCNMFIMGYAIAFVRFFVETKRGFVRKFWLTYLFFGVMFGCISYFWLYLDVYL